MTELGKKRVASFSADREESNDDFKIRKGTKLQRIGDSNETDNGKRTYVSYIKEDNLRYIGDASELFGKYHKIQLKASNDLQVAKGKSLVDAYVHVLSEVPISKLIDSDREDYKYTKDEIKTRTKIYNDTFKDRYSFNASFDEFQGDLIKDNEVSKLYFKYLEDRGYNAMYDYNDREYAETPLIIFNRGRDAVTTSIKEITNADLDEAWLQDYKDFMG